MIELLMTKNNVERILDVQRKRKIVTAHMGAVIIFSPLQTNSCHRRQLKRTGELLAASTIDTSLRFALLPISKNFFLDL